MPKAETPIGTLAWTGELSERTLITMPDGSRRTFYSLISHTNGEALLWLAEAQSAGVPASDARTQPAQAAASLPSSPGTSQDPEKSPSLAVDPVNEADEGP